MSSEDGMIDYSSYSIPELQEAAASIDAQAFPRNYSNLQDALRRARIRTTGLSLRLVTEYNGNRYEIIEAPPDFYVVRYNEQNTLCTHDHLQDDFEMALRCARNEFGVPLESWRKPLPNESSAFILG